MPRNTVWLDTLLRAEWPGRHLNPPACPAQAWHSGHCHSGFHLVGQRILHNPQLHVNQFPSPDSGGMPYNNPTKPLLWLVVKPALERPAVPCHAAGARDRGIICSNAACQGYQTTMNSKYLILPKLEQCRLWENKLLFWLLLLQPVVHIVYHIS